MINIDSTSDQLNNRMRHEHRLLSEIEKEQILIIKDMGLDMHEYIAELGTARELSIAKTKIEEAVMWVVKHITR